MNALSRRIVFAAVAGVSLGSLGCDRPSAASADASTTRSESITAASNAPVTSAAPSASAHASPRAPRKLCDGQLTQAGLKLPKAAFTPVATPGAEPPADRITPRSGHWTWINFFAAWCGPCKEEMPRLRGFQQRLASHLDVAFVSFDDDERQLRRFLDAQPADATGVRSALWLEPGKQRSTWLSALDVKDPPDLPAHVLVDPSGKVRCIIRGAIDEVDFPTVASIVQQ